MFVFQNSFWLNLHQFLRGEVYRRGANRPLGLDPSSLGDSERAAWAAAVDAYADVAKRDFLFDPLIVRIHNTLGAIGDVAQLPDGALDPAVVTALNRAAPIYRTRMWPARQRDNDAWIASTRVLLQQHETALSASHAATYRITWPREPYLVDVVGEIGPNSAVTHAGPPGFAAHIQPGSGSPRNVGDAPLELLFHEASHVPSVGGRITTMIADECARQKVMPPGNLWHAMIMFTSGALAKIELGKTARSYASYGDRYDQLTRVERSAFEGDWQPYLDGKLSFEQALHDLVRDTR